MTATAKAKTKFSSRNLNAVYKAPLAKAAENGGTGRHLLYRPLWQRCAHCTYRCYVYAGGYHSSSRMLVLKSSSAGRSSVLTAQSLTVAAPAPINTPSLRKENNGQDVHVHLVPTGKVGWGTSPTSTNCNSNNGDERESRAYAGADRSNAPFSSSQPHQSEYGGRQVRGTGSDSSPQSHERQRQAAATSGRSFGSSGVVYGASTGRWGDDAVEQDIARSDMLRARQKERDFPQLKDDCVAVDQRFSGDSNTNTSSYGHDHRQRYDQYEAAHRGGAAGNGHEDGFSSRGDRFDGPRTNSYGYSNNNQSGCYHPSDARYDSYGQAPPACRQYPDNHERHHDSFKREYHHPQERNHSSYYGEDDIARTQGRQYQLERRGCDAEPTHRNEEIHNQARSDDHQSPEVGCEPVNQDLTREPAAQQLSSDSLPQANASVSQHVKDDSGRVKNGTTLQQSIPTSVWKKVDTDFPVRQSSDVQLPMRSSVHPSSNFGGRPLSTTVPHRPSYVVAPAQSVAPVRILKRDGPRMLFDPKTGTMVNAEDTRGSSRSQRPAVLSSTASETEPSSSSRESISSTVEPQPRKAASSVIEPQSYEATADAAVKRIVHVRPEQIKKRSADEKSPVVIIQVKNEPESLPEESEETKPALKAPVTQVSKPLRVKKAPRDAVVSNKKGIIKAKTKKCVLVYRPVAKPASDSLPEVEAVAPAPLSMKKFSELFTTSAAPVETAKQSIQTLAQSATSTVYKPPKKQEKSIERPAGRINKAREPRALRYLPKDCKVVRERAKSSASDASSTHSSQTSVGGQPASIVIASLIPTAREETQKLGHSKIRNGVNVDMLKQIPEGGGVVVLTDTQEGIEFVAEDADNQFETVRSRRALLLERKQTRESAAVLKTSGVPYPRRSAFKPQAAGSGIVMVTPNRSAKRTLSVGVRVTRSITTKSVASKVGTTTDYSSISVRAQELSGEQSDAPREQLRRSKTLPESKTRKSLKPAAKKRVIREPSVSSDASSSRQEKRVSTHLPATQLAATAEHQHNVEERTAHASAKPPRKQRDKLEKPRQKVYPLSPPAQARVEKSDVPMQEAKSTPVRPPRRDSENSKTEQQPREAKSQRSSNSNIPATSLKMKYVPKVSKCVKSGEVIKSKATEPTELLRLSERVVITKSAKPGAGAKTSKKAKPIEKLSVTSTSTPDVAPASSAVKAKETKHKLAPRSAIRTVVAPVPVLIVAAAPAVNSAHVHSATESKSASRKVSLAVVPKSHSVKPKPTDERPPAFKKRLSKSQADLHAPAAVTKSYKQIYVVKKSSSAPAPTSTAA